MNPILRSVLVVLVLVPATALAQTLESDRGTLQGFLAPIASHPAVRASAAALAAAQAQLDGANSPVSASLSGGVQGFFNDEIDLAPEVPGVQGLPGVGTQITADVSFRPFAFGDIADLVTQRELSLEQARLGYLETLTLFEAQALEAALGVGLAEDSLELAREGIALSERALDATRIRLERGGATDRDLRDSEANLQEAQNFAQRAEADLELARLNLANLVGDADLPDLPELPLPDGASLEVRRSQINVQLARIGQGSANRDLYPVVQAGFDWNLGDENTLGISLESRTLQPTLSYTYQNPGRQAPQTAVNGSFQIGVAATLSPGQFKAAEAAQRQLDAAEAGLQATVDGAELRRRALAKGWDQAQRQLALAELEFRNRELDAREARAREELGISTPLETQSEVIDLLQADLELRSARQAVLSATLDYYRFFAIPVSEVLK